MTIVPAPHHPFLASAGTERLRVRGVSLAVRDLGWVEAFYRDVLGLAVLARADDAVRLGVDGAALVELKHRPGALPDDPAGAGLFHTAFLLPTRRDLARWLDHAVRAGARLDGASDHAVSEAIYLSDPEGNGIEVYADRPRSTWHWEGDQIAMANSRLDLAALAGLDPRPWNGAPPGTRIGHVHLQVGDTEAAEPFYVGALGLQVTRRWSGALFLAANGYHHHLAVNSWNSRGAGPRDPGRAGLQSVTLRSRGDGISLADPWGTTIHLSTDGATP